MALRGLIIKYARQVLARAKEEQSALGYPDAQLKQDLETMEADLWNLQ